LLFNEGFGVATKGIASSNSIDIDEPTGLKLVIRCFIEEVRTIAEQKKCSRKMLHLHIIILMIFLNKKHNIALHTQHRVNLMLSKLISTTSLGLNGQKRQTSQNILS